LTEDSDGGNEWIFSPFSMNTVSKAKITDDLQDNIIDMTTDRRFQTILKEISYRNSGVKSARIILPLDEVQ
jgi:hypothetical protein